MQVRSTRHGMQHVPGVVGVGGGGGGGGSLPEMGSRRGGGQLGRGGEEGWHMGRQLDV